MFPPSLSPSCCPCMASKHSPTSRTDTDSGSCCFFAATTSAAVNLAPKINHGDRMSGKYLNKGPANRLARRSLVWREAKGETWARRSAQRSRRMASGTVWYSPWSSSTSLGVPFLCALVSTCRYTLPACGSPWTWPCTRAISANTAASSSPHSWGSRLLAARAGASEILRRPSSSSIVSTDEHVSPSRMRGILTSERCWRSRAARRALRASERRSSSIFIASSKSDTTHCKS
mmetsp:Transcript_47637/g.112764  ORF Transcript_47637/g.112764 Transcript_47637/m.112764 type:complete len:232 (+) Transcript_47637:531-1226(+)